MFAFFLTTFYYWDLTCKKKISSGRRHTTGDDGNMMPELASLTRWIQVDPNNFVSFPNMKRNQDCKRFLWPSWSSLFRRQSASCFKALAQYSVKPDIQEQQQTGSFDMLLTMQSYLSMKIAYFAMHLYGRVKGQERVKGNCKLHRSFIM